MKSLFGPVCSQIDTPEFILCALSGAFAALLSWITVSLLAPSFSAPDFIVRDILCLAFGFIVGAIGVRMAKSLPPRAQKNENGT